MMDEDIEPDITPPYGVTIVNPTIRHEVRTGPHVATHDHATMPTPYGSLVRVLQELDTLRRVAVDYRCDPVFQIHMHELHRWEKTLERLVTGGADGLIVDLWRRVRQHLGRT